MKKKHIIGLSTLLLVLLLGLFTQCYALSESQVENFVYNYWTIRMNKDSDATKTWIESNSSVWQQIANASEFYNSFIFGEDINSSGRIYFFWNNNNANLYIYNQTRITTNTYNWYYIQIGINGSGQNYIYDYTSSTTYRMYDMYANYSYSIRNITNGNGGAVKYSAFSVRPDTWLDGPYVDALGFTFIPASSSTYADVGDFEDIPFYSVSGDNDLYIGQLVIPEEYEISYRTFSNFYWKYNNWQVRELGKVTYLEYFTTENNETIYDVYLYNKYAYANTIYSLYWTDDTQDPFALAGTNFYISNRYTSIVNGALDINNTFSGDYDDEYNDVNENIQNQTNIENAIGNTINAPVDISGEISQYISGDIYDIASSFGFDSKVSIYFTFIEDFLKNVCNVLLDDDDVYFDYSMHGESATRIYSSDIGLPNGHPLKVFISVVLVFLTVYLLYFQFMKLFEYLQTANLSNAIKSQDVSFYIFKM